ncbi:MAG: hypothetical protein OEY49_18430 [Candidatus Heimdallarchaeota archaeon]|nr:hypothetical protein [Candidatus Heimdallarchaeota archaeon]
MDKEVRNLVVLYFMYFSVFRNRSVDFDMYFDDLVKKLSMGHKLHVIAIKSDFEKLFGKELLHTPQFILRKRSFKNHTQNIMSVITYPELFHNVRSLINRILVLNGWDSTFKFRYQINSITIITTADQSKKRRHQKLIKNTYGEFYKLYPYQALSTDAVYSKKIAKTKNISFVFMEEQLMLIIKKPVIDRFIRSTKKQHHPFESDGHINYTFLDEFADFIHEIVLIEFKEFMDYLEELYNFKLNDLSLLYMFFEKGFKIVSRFGKKK